MRLELYKLITEAPQSYGGYQSEPQDEKNPQPPTYQQQPHPQQYPTQQPSSFPINLDPYLPFPPSQFSPGPQDQTNGENVDSNFNPDPFAWKYGRLALINLLNLALLGTFSGVLLGLSVDTWYNSPASVLFGIVISSMGIAYSAFLLLWLITSPCIRARRGPLHYFVFKWYNIIALPISIIGTIIILATETLNGCKVFSFFILVINFISLIVSNYTVDGRQLWSHCFILHLFAPFIILGVIINSFINRCLRPEADKGLNIAGYRALLTDLLPSSGPRFGRFGVYSASKWTNGVENTQKSDIEAPPAQPQTYQQQYNVQPTQPLVGNQQIQSDQ